MKRTLREDKAPKVKSAQLQGSTAMQDGGKARRSHQSLPEILELKPSSKRHEGSLEDPGFDEELRVYKEGAGINTRAGCVTRRNSRVPDGKADDAGNE